MDAVILPRHNRALSQHELSLARRICDEASQAVASREHYITTHGVDRAFALPDANWSYEAPNEFLQLFLRLATGDPPTLQHLRFFSQVFSGYSLYKVRDARGLEASKLQISEDLYAEIELALAQRNPRYVDYWRSLTAGLPERYVVKPPPILGECGHDLGGVIVNHDTCAYQERVNLIHDSGLGDWIDSIVARYGEVRICEIGAGYGALAHWVMSAFPQCTYTIIDLPESILFSRLYLSIARPDLSTSFGLRAARHGIRFVPNYMADQIDEPFDLVINTLSMSEMSAYQVKRYVECMKTKWLVSGGLFFEQNQNCNHMGLICAADIFASEFPERMNLNPSNAMLQHGMPNIWSLQPIGMTPPSTLPGSSGDAARHFESARKKAALKLESRAMRKAAKFAAYKLLGQERAERFRSKLYTLTRTSPVVLSRQD